MLTESSYFYPIEFLERYILKNHCHSLLITINNVTIMFPVILMILISVLKGKRDTIESCIYSGRKKWRQWPRRHWCQLSWKTEQTWNSVYKLNSWVRKFQLMCTFCSCNPCVVRSSWRFRAASVLITHYPALTATRVKSCPACLWSIRLVK